MTTHGTNAGAKEKGAIAKAVERELAAEEEMTLGGQPGATGDASGDAFGGFSFANAMRLLVFCGCLAFAAYHCWAVIRGMPFAYLHRPVHVAFAVSLGFLVYPFNKKRGPGFADLALALLAVVTFATPALQAQAISERLVGVDPLSGWQIFVGISAVLLVLTLIQRVVGTALTVVCLIFLAYAFLGQYTPGALTHKGFTGLEIVEYLSFGLTGLYSSAIGVSSTYIAAFIVFGTFLERCGAGDVMMELGRALTGAYRGGPAKIAVITSAFFGTISGSAAANVYATGAFTIPMMKKAGYKPNFAGAVEAAASTGGQIMPPIMGAAAFLMADLLGIPYLEICKAAVIPAFLYFFSIIMMVDFEAAKLGLAGVPREELPKLRDVAKRLYLLLPIVVLLAVMIVGYTPFLAAMIATAACIAVSWLDKKNAIGPKKFLNIMSTSGRRLILIVVACLGAGVVIGVVSLTGLGLNLASVVMSISGGNQLLALVFVMIASIIMGMGTPTTVAYVLVATLGVPALRELGFELLPAHFFVFYFGVISMVTPPVAVAAYAGAEVAGGDMMRTAFTGSRLCAVAFIVPFFFMFDSSLLMQGEWQDILLAFATATLGAVSLAAALERWFIRPLPLPLAAVFLVAALSLIIPGWKTDLFGLALFIAGTLFCRLTAPTTAAPPAAR